MLKLVRVVYYQYHKCAHNPAFSYKMTILERKRIDASDSHFFRNISWDTQRRLAPSVLAIATLWPRSDQIGCYWDDLSVILVGIGCSQGVVPFYSRIKKQNINKPNHRRSLISTFFIRGLTVCKIMYTAKHFWIYLGLNSQRAYTAKHFWIYLGLNSQLR